MDGRAVTVSFGVTEIQPGDTPETMLRRADRALLMAKANGRNTVVQLGSGSPENAPVPSSSGLLAAVRPKEFLERDLVTPVPVKMAIEKLRGFVADHQAKIVAIDNNNVRLEIDDRPVGRLRRFTDRPVVFRIDLCFVEEQLHSERLTNGQPIGATTRTKIKVVVSPRKERDRRRRDVMARARDVLMSFRSYLMASELDAPASAGAIGRAKRILAPWLGSK